MVIKKARFFLGLVFSVMLFGANSVFAKTSPQPAQKTSDSGPKPTDELGCGQGVGALSWEEEGARFCIHQNDGSCTPIVPLNEKVFKDLGARLNKVACLRGATVMVSKDQPVFFVYGVKDK